MRYYSSVAQATTLTAGITAGETSIQVASATGFPASHPFTLVLSPGTAEEEIVTVTATTGTTLSVIRGEDGSTAMSHSAGAGVRHMVTARDLREPQQHLGATTAVHGVSGALVGTSDTQTLTNKTIDATQNTLLNLPESAPSAAIAVDTNSFVLPYDTSTLTGATSGTVLIAGVYTVSAGSTGGTLGMDLMRGNTLLARATESIGANESRHLSVTTVDTAPNGDAYRAVITGPSGATLKSGGRNTLAIMRF